MKNRVKSGLSFPLKLCNEYISLLKACKDSTSNTTTESKQGYNTEKTKNEGQES